MKPIEIAFHFRATTIYDDNGKVIGKNPKPDSVKLNIKTLEMEDILSIIEAGGKQAELLLEAVNDVIYQEARAVIGDAMDNKKTVDQALIDSSDHLLSWEAIANKPKAERKGHGISKEDWEAFAEDYKAVMAIAMPEKTPEQIATAAEHLSKKFANCRFNKEAITALRGYAGVWYANTSNKEDFATIYEALEQRAETLLNADTSSKLLGAI